MKYTIYKITNQLNSKYYIGKHQTENINDSYYGSGKAIKAAIKKYGKENFKKEILFVFDNELEMNQKERELITEEVVNDPNSYNCGIGGEGGPHFKNHHHTKETIEKISKHNWSATEEGRKYLKQRCNTPIAKQQNSERLKKFWTTPRGIELRQRYSNERKNKFKNNS